MNNHSVTAKITGVAGNTATAALEVSTDFYPIVYVSISSTNPKNITENLIFKVFQDSDKFTQRCKPFIEKMESDSLKQGETYLVPYLRMWPPQKGERIFTLACIVNRGKDNCAGQGDIYVEMPEVSGLKINNISGGVIKDVYTHSTVPLELSLASGADRTPTGIKAVPLIFYVMNNGKRTDVGKVHLSVAPKDVFSIDEMKKTIEYLESNPRKTYQHDCITAVRVSSEKLLGVRMTGAIKQNSFTILDWEEYLQKNKYLKERIDMNLTHNSDGEVFNPIDEDEKASCKFHNSIKESLGYHIYSVGYHIHTEVFIIYNDIYDAQQTMYWQGGIRFGDKWKNLSIKVIDECIRMHIKSWSDWCYKNYGYYKSYSFFLKLQRALMILLAFNILGIISPIESYASYELFNAKIEQKQNKQTCSDITLERYNQILTIIESSGFEICKTFVRTVQTASDDELVQMINYDIRTKNIIFFDHDCDATKPLYCIVFYQFDNGDKAIAFANKMFGIKKDILEFPVKLSDNLFFRFCVKTNMVMEYQTWDSVEEEEARIKKLLLKCDEMDWDKVYQ